MIPLSCLAHCRHFKIHKHAYIQVYQRLYRSARQAHTIANTQTDTCAKSSHLICSFPTIFPFQGCQAKCHRVSFSATPPSSPLPLTISRATQVEKSTKCKEEKTESENRRCWWPQKLLQNSKTEAVSSRMTYTLWIVTSVLSDSLEMLCVCAGYSSL